jgi:hypothetical protein
VVNTSKHDQKVVIPFLRVERCHLAEIHRQIFFVHCAACLPNTGALDWFLVFLTARQQMTGMSRPQQAGIVTVSEKIACSGSSSYMHQLGK